jgi:MFS family permease
MLSTTMRKHTGSTSAWYTLVANQPSPFIFRGIGLNGNTISLLATGVVGIVEFLFTIPAVLWVDKFGRKKILIAGAIGMASCHFIVAGIIGAFNDDWPAHRAGGWAAVVFVWIFVINFAYSWGELTFQATKAAVLLLT